MISKNNVSIQQSGFSMHRDRIVAQKRGATKQNGEMIRQSETQTRILFIDAQTMFREGLRALLEASSGAVLVTEAASRDEALAATRTIDPHIILLDLNLGDDSGTELISNLVATTRRARIILLTSETDERIFYEAIRLGVVGLVRKDQSVDVLLKAISKVRAGEVWIDRSLMAAVLTEMNRAYGEQLDPEAAKIAALTEREHQVVALIGEGCKNKIIATQLSISETTVRHHLTSIFSKLGVSDQLELVVYAYKNHLLGHRD